VTYIDEAFAKKCIQYPFVATTRITNESAQIEH